MQVTVNRTNTLMDIGQKTKVLVVDDEQLIQQLISFKLRSVGYDVVLASNGEEALALADEHLPDIIVMDVMMPVMSGFETLAQLKNNPATAAIPVIMLTGHSVEGAVVEGLELGADDYIAKPFSPSELAARVKSVLLRSVR
jgi:DNA-binding response OmpR family regulator